MLLTCLFAHCLCQAQGRGGEKYSLQAVEIVAHENQNVIGYLPAELLHEQNVIEWFSFSRLLLVFYSTLSPLWGTPQLRTECWSSIPEGPYLKTPDSNFKKVTCFCIGMESGLQHFPPPESKLSCHVAIGRTFSSHSQSSWLYTQPSWPQEHVGSSW